MHCQGANIPIWGIDSFLCSHYVACAHTAYLQVLKFNYLQLGPCTHWGKK